MEMVTIGIASLGRPCLSRTLASLGEIEVPAGLQVEIVVADDDAGGAAAARVAAGAPWKLPVRVVHVAAGNISAARNACLEAANGTWMAFVDDDEWVDRDWLVRLFAAQADYQADVVVGPVFPQYPAGTPDWLVAANPLYVDWGKRGRVLDTGRSGNVLIRRALIGRHGLRFDLRLGKTGGEDTDFFNRLHRAGARLVATDDARIYEEVPAARLDPAYIRRRALRSGQSYAQFRLKGTTGRDLSGLIFHADAAAKCLVNFASALALRPIHPPRSFRFQQRGWMNLGKLRQFTGRGLPSMY
ncbi:MAG TPA: glycosyltransferase [Geminicoccus sp.]|jgi:succinoglycan biosynthesis protein ExoM|uniref:glycosyltransferase family 2 protein n=1 Tax=Geminicoccus sp. TaxID=2024832 RepID=UPI002E304829|nr:glycosyltransferase [Geminicoccus sp.]HEX2526161.1 glycosyltransferase [Geminicoccus sp.]